MNNRDFARYVAAKLNEEIDKIAGDMVQGKAVDFEAYKFAAGIARGFSLANGILQDALRALEEDDDD